MRFGSWIGGDRDGNPNVTPDVTRRATLLARWVAAELYLKEVVALRDELSMTTRPPHCARVSGTSENRIASCLRQVRTRLDQRPHVD